MAAAPPTIPIPKTIGLLAGPQIIGHSMNMAFFGGLVVQCYLYYIGFPKDRLFNKCLVGGILLLEIVQVCLSTVKMYQNFGTGYGHMPTFGTVGLFWYSSPFATALVSLIVQHFFAWRLWILSGKKWFVPVPVILTSLTQAGAGMSSAVNAHIINKFALLQKANFNRSSVWLGGTALCDCIIAGLMMYYLLSSRTEFKSTNSIITKFVKIAIETGAVCATFATLDLITFFVYQNNNIHVMFAMTLSKLYSNSLLVVLNARIHIQGGRDFTSGQATSAGGNPDISLVMWSERDRETRTNNGINVNISRTVDHDTINSDPKHDTFLHMGDNTTKV